MLYSESRDAVSCISGFGVNALCEAHRVLECLTQFDWVVGPTEGTEELVFAAGQAWSYSIASASSHLQQITGR